MTLFHLNIRSLNSKRKSLENILQKLSPSIVTLNETALKFKNKPKVKHYFPFNRNRTDQIMGGIATLVPIENKDDLVEICKGSHNDEFMITRHCNFSVPLNVVNIYGEQECRSSNKEIEDRWGRILGEIFKIEARGEMILIVGDLNKHVGNDEFGVQDNHEKISFGGELIRGFLSSGRYICMNNSLKAKGGPFTRFDPSDKERKSCLDYVIVSIALELLLRV